MYRSLLIILVIFLIISGFCYSKPSASPNYGGQLRGVLSSDILNWDPAFAVDTKTGHLISLVYSNLFRYSSDSLQLEPEIVEQYFLTADGLLYYFKLREDVYFTDGTQLTAADVYYSWTRLMDSKLHSPRTWLLANVAQIQLIDDHRFQVLLKQPASEFLYLTSLPNLAIVSRNNPNLKTNPIGSGPWKLVEWRLDECLRLVANTDYCLGRPYLDELIFYILQGLPAYLRFEAGEVDWMRVEPEILPRWQKLYPRALYFQEKSNTFYIGLTNTKYPFNIPEVRQALNYATDQTSLITYLLHNSAVPADGPIPPLLGGTKQETYGYDLVKARSLLAAVNLEHGFTMDLWVVNDPLMLAMARALQTQWSLINVQVKITLSDFAGLQQATLNQTIDSFLMGWSMDTPLKQDFLVPTFSRRNWGAGGNRAFFKDELFEDLINREQWQAAEERVVQLAPWVFLWHGIEIIAVQPWINNWQTHPSYYGVNFTKVWRESTGRER